MKYVLLFALLIGKTALAFGPPGTRTAILSKAGEPIEADLVAYWKTDSVNPTDRSLNGRDLNGVLVTDADVGPGHNAISRGIALGSTKYLRAKTLEGWESPGGITNTGLVYDATLGVLWMGDYGNGRIFRLSKKGAVEISHTVSTANQIQGVAVDTSDETLWFTEFAAQKVRHYNKAGSNQNDGWDLAYSPNHCAYEPATDSLWVVENIAAGSTQKIHRYLCADGTLQETLDVTLDATAALDGLCYDAANDVLWATADDSAATTADRVYKINATTGAVISQFSAFNCVEGIALDSTDNSLFIGVDAGFHLNSFGGNRVFRYSQAGVLQDQVIQGAISISLWCKPAVDNMTNHGLAARVDGVGLPSWEILVLSSTNMFFRTYTPGEHSVSAGAGRFNNTSHWYHVVAVYNGATKTNYLDGAVDATGSVTGDLRETLAAIWIGRRNGSSSFDGIISDVKIFKRALSAQEVAAMYRKG